MVTKYHFLLVSPDGQWILGQAPELQNYFVAAAMRSIGAGAAGGIGEAIANHIIEGRPPFDMYNLVSTYRKVASSRLSRLVAHPVIFRLFMKGNFDAYVL